MITALLLLLLALLQLRLLACARFIVFLGVFLTARLGQAARGFAATRLGVS